MRKERQHTVHFQEIGHALVPRNVGSGPAFKITGNIDRCECRMTTQTARKRKKSREREREARERERRKERNIEIDHQIPVQWGEMRPLARTPVASTMTRPAPPVAKRP